METIESQETGARIVLENRQVHKECLVCSPDAVSDCEELARAFADHCVEGGAVPEGDALLRRISRVQDWVVCDGCQSRLSGEDKLRLMSLWMVVEALRNWLKIEMRVGLKNLLPAAPPIQLA